MVFLIGLVLFVLSLAWVFFVAAAKPLSIFLLTWINEQVAGYGIVITDKPIALVLTLVILLSGLGLLISWIWLFLAPKHKLTFGIPIYIREVFPLLVGGASFCGSIWAANWLWSLIPAGETFMTAARISSVVAVLGGILILIGSIVYTFPDTPKEEK